jgi:hypothetical protein
VVLPSSGEMNPQQEQVSAQQCQGEELKKA